MEEVEQLILILIQQEEDLEVKVQIQFFQVLHQQAEVMAEALKEEQHLEDRVDLVVEAEELQDVVAEVPVTLLQ